MELLKTALVTGANKGIGYQIAKKLLEKNYNIILACRSLENAEKARTELLSVTSSKARVDVAQLDISSSDSITKFVAAQREAKTNIDVLVNNAGIAFKGDAFDDNVVQVTFATNFYGTVEFTEKVLPLLNENSKVVIIGSMAGGIRIIKNEDLKKRFLDENLSKENLFDLAKKFADEVHDGSYEAKGWSKSAYGTSKLLINLYPRVFMKYDEVVKRKIQVYSMCPGWCKSDMAGWEKPPKTAEMGADNAIYLVELTSAVDAKYQGKHFSENKVAEYI